MWEGESPVKTQNCTPINWRMIVDMQKYYPTNQGKKYLDLEFLESNQTQSWRHCIRLQPSGGSDGASSLFIPQPQSWAPSLPSPFTLFPHHTTSLVMPPSLLGECARKEIVKKFPLKNSIILSDVWVYLMVSLTL